MNDAFWEGGDEAYEQGLRGYYDPLLRDLRDRLARCSNDADRADCESQIQQLEDEYRSKLDGIGDSLF